MERRKSFPWSEIVGTLNQALPEGKKIEPEDLKFLERFNVRKKPDGTLMADTPDGPKTIQFTRCSFTPVIAYSEKGKIMACPVPGLPKYLITNPPGLQKTEWVA